MSESSLIAKLNAISSRIEHQNNLTGQRTSWLVTSQSFLFAAFVAVVAQVGSEGVRRFPLARLLLILIPLMGLLLPTIALGAMIGDSFVLRHWRRERDRILVTSQAQELDWPRVDRRPLLHAIEELPPYVAAFIFLLAWTAIIFEIST
jgi:hypothetical protein